MNTIGSRIVAPMLAVVMVAIGVAAILLLRDTAVFVPASSDASSHRREFRELLTNLQDVSRVAEGAPPSNSAALEGWDEEIFYPPDTIACFWNYVVPIVSAADAAERKRLVHRRATALRAMSRKELEALGLRSMTGISFSFAEGEQSVQEGEALPAVISGEVDLTDALMERWIASACHNGERQALRAAALQLWFRVVSGSLVEVDSALLELSCTVLGYFDDPQDIATVAIPLLRALQALSPDAKITVEELLPIVFVLSSLARLDGDDAAMVQREVLALIEAPWLEGERASWLMQLTAGSSFERWEWPLSDLLRTGSPGAKWGAVEGLRFFAARKQNPLDSNTLCRMVPTALCFESYTALRWAVVELIAAYGGAQGAAELGALMQDRSFPYRADVISFLAHKNKLDSGLCRMFARDSDIKIRDAAIHALGTLVRYGDPSAYGELRVLALDKQDPEVQKAAIAALGTTGAPQALNDLILVASEGEPSVQFRAISEIGRLPTNAATELLEFARDGRKDPGARSLAFDEALLDLPDERVPAVLELMYRDRESEIAIKGYVAMAAIAIGTNDDSRIAEWRSLSPPPSLLAKAGELSEEQAKSWLGEAAARAFSGTIDAKVEAFVQQEIARLADPELQREVESQDALVAIAPEGSAARAWLGQRFAYEKRMARLLASLRSEQGD